jgi:7,8-dihydropterin-6-yl-methyl-4-(beta-D-ribofuranosyl)aminobenzene 5'-phosphate synthase
MRILTLIADLAVSDKLFSERGISLYIEQGGSKLVFDFGCGDSFAKNAKRMAVNLQAVDCAVMSHNHEGHSGGLDAFFAENTKAKVFAKMSAAVDCSKKSGIFRIPAGKSSAFFEKYRDRFVLFTCFQEICPNMYLVSTEYDDPQYVNPDTSYYRRIEGKAVSDDFEGEVFLVTFPTGKQEDGCVIVTGCAHGGIVNVAETVRANWSHSPIRAVVGGLHLVSSGKALYTAEQIEKMTAKLRSLVQGVIYTCGCTGHKPYDLMKSALGDQLQYLKGGEDLAF